MQERWLPWDLIALLIFLGLKRELVFKFVPAVSFLLILPLLLLMSVTLFTDLQLKVLYLKLVGLLYRIASSLVCISASLCCSASPDSPQKKRELCSCRLLVERSEGHGLIITRFTLCWHF